MNPETDIERDPNRYTHGSDHDHGEPRTWEITWTSGHTEKVTGHQITHSGTRILNPLFSSSDSEAPKLLIHGVAAGHWGLRLSAREDDIRTIRDVTDGEPAPEA